MADGSRDQVLVDFQAFTGIEDFDTCAAILEQHEWKLEAAVNSIMPSYDTVGPGCEVNIPSAFPADVPVERADSVPFISSPVEDFVNISDDEPSAASGASSSAMASSSSYTSSGIHKRMLNFTVEYRDRNIPVVIADSQTVGCIKDILEVEINVPANQQVLKGIKRKFEDTTILRDLHLPKDNTLYVLTPQIRNPTLTRSTEETNHTHMSVDINQEYTLEISYYENTRYKCVQLKFPGRKTVQEVKQDVSNLSDIPVRHQIWTGWPDGTLDSLMLSQCGLSIPLHHLDLTKANNSTTNKPKYTTREVVMEVSSSDDEDDEVVDSFPEEEIFAPESANTNIRRNVTLMPENFTDETQGLEHFTREFKIRYGDFHPFFFLGSLDDAIKESLQQKAKDRKLLAVYLHHDRSIASNVFCSQLLCSDGIVNYLSTNFITWAWDMTHECNTARLIAMATRHFGSVVATQMRNYRSEELPALLVISRSRATNEIVDVIQGHVTLDELMTRLIHSVEIFQEQQAADISEEQERTNREMIKQQQDADYEESLAADKAKAEIQREEEAKRQAVLEVELQKQREEERLRQEEEDAKKAIQRNVSRSLAVEPPEDATYPVSKIRFRVKGGDIINRRFRADDTIQTLLNFLITKGFHTEEYKVLTTYPRRDITQLDESLTLESARLFPQETLILEEK